MKRPAQQRTRESKPGRKQSKSPPSVPWEDPQVREDVLKVLQPAFPRAVFAKTKAHRGTHARQHAPVLYQRALAGD